MKFRKDMKINKRAVKNISAVFCVFLSILHIYVIDLSLSIKYSTISSWFLNFVLFIINLYVYVSQI